jgi:serine/threonine protein kinase
MSGEDLMSGFDLRLMSWGDGSEVPTSEKNLVVVGTDNDDLLHIRIFDAAGNRIKDTDETQLPDRAGAVASLKQQLPGLLPPHVLTVAENEQVIAEVTSIVGQTLMSDSSPGTETWIDHVATEFDRAWHEGQRPQIEDFLAKARGDGQRLFAELLRIELQRRKRLGQSPTAAEYEHRFSDHSDAVRAAFQSEGLPIGPADGPPATVTRRPGETAEDDHGATLTYSYRKPDGRVESLVGAEGRAKLRRTFPIGSILQGRYVIESELGHGGMGLVYRGRDQRLGDRPVAIKVILPDERRGTIGEANARAAFEEEARLGANLVHPAIATVYDFDLHEDVPFTVFEYIPGETLGSLLRRRGRLPLDEVRLIIGPLAQALDFAHSRYIVHRDLKPENIRATEQGQFKVLDLGLAREFLRESDWSGFTGTPAYASPEQAAGLPCDGRTDQYSLALIAFELLTGRRPFESQSVGELLDMHRNREPVRPQSLRADLPEPVCEALLQALARDPNQRFRTCEHFALALGCQLLSATASPPQVLAVAQLHYLTGRWRSSLLDNQDDRDHVTRLFQWPLPRYRAGANGRFIVLTPDSIWAAYRDEIRRWPLESLVRMRSWGKDLHLRFRGGKRRLRQSFHFFSRQECQQWSERIKQLCESLKAASRNDAAGRALEIRVEPVVLLQQQPDARYQSLGLVAARHSSRAAVEFLLQIQGAMLGADAVVSISQETLPGPDLSIQRVRGTAIRFVDDEGRMEFRSQQFASLVLKLMGRMLGLILGFLGLEAFIVVRVIASSHRGLPAELSAELSGHLGTALGYLFALALWPLFIVVLTRRLLWPQLLRPAALAVLALAVRPIAIALGQALLLFRTRLSDNPYIFYAIFLYGLYALIPVRVMCLVMKRAWPAYANFRRLMGSSPRTVPVNRTAISLPAMAVSLLFGIALLGFYLSGGQDPVARFIILEKQVSKQQAQTKALERRFEGLYGAK